MKMGQRKRWWLADGAIAIPPGQAHPSAGFSLIELLCVVTLLLILTTLYWSSSTPSRHQQRQIACRENLARIFMALTIYAHSQNDRFPELPGARLSEEPLDLLIPRFTVETANFICPGAKDSPLPAGESFRNRTISYSYYMGRRAAQGGDVLMTDWQIDTLAKTAGQPLFSTTGRAPGNNHGKTGGNLLYGDGRVESSPGPAPGPLVLTQGVVLLNPK
jgi:prepilin-type N-terminal cleavage/methylation domain-containing protein/prepilin-type processing-associated H-X9-DG protein